MGSDTNTLGNVILERRLSSWNGDDVEEGLRERNNGLGPGEVSVSEGGG